MLDIVDFIVERGGDPTKIRQSQSRRYAPEETVDEVITLYEDHRRSTILCFSRNTKPLRWAPKLIPPKKKLEPAKRFSAIAVCAIELYSSDARHVQKNEDVGQLIQAKESLQERKRTIEQKVVEKEGVLNRKIKSIGNYVHDSVPISNNEDNNTLIRKWAPTGVHPTKQNCLSHHEVLARIDGYDPERGVKIVGHRGYCLTGYGLFLNLALVNYGLEFLWKKGYKPNQPPHFMLRDYMAKTAQLEQFDEELYKVTDDGQKQTDKYLIATSEQPLSALHDSEWLQDKDLPIK
ncbi:MAG: hypothetical protein Q9190_002214 [Brigantiaea leucoxantha]